MYWQTAILVFHLLFFSFITPVKAADSSNQSFMTIPPQLIPPLVFEDGNDVQHALADYRGRYVLLNVWATWCGPCVHELPSLDALQQKVDLRHLVIIPLLEDRNESGIAAFYRIHAIERLPIAVDSSGIASTILHLRGLPTTLLIDPEGREIARIEGATDWASPSAVAFLQAQTGGNLLKNNIKNM